MRWVKATERLPEKGKRTAAKYKGRYMQLEVLDKEVVRAGGLKCNSRSMLEGWLPGIEWLDESPINTAHP
jgi:hypothetical protein